MRAGPGPLRWGSAMGTSPSCAKAVIARRPITVIAVSTLPIQFHLIKAAHKSASRSTFPSDDKGASRAKSFSLFPNALRVNSYCPAPPRRNQARVGRRSASSTLAGDGFPWKRKSSPAGIRHPQRAPSSSMGPGKQKGPTAGVGPGNAQTDAAGYPTFVTLSA